MNTYRTSKVAKIIGIHPNTVRKYEELGLMPKAKREPNGYRAFTDFHIEQLRLARIAFQIEALQNGLRKKIVETVKISAQGDFDKKAYHSRNIDTQKTLNMEQVLTLIEASKDTPIHMQVLFAVLLGLRRCEINGVKYSDIDYINRTLKVQRRLGKRPNTTDCRGLPG